jgi:hypothetical protein
VIDRASLLARLLAVHLALLGTATINTAWAEDAASDSITSGKSTSGSENGSGTTGNGKAAGDEHAGKNEDSTGGGTGDQHAGPKDGVTGGEEADTAGPRHGWDHAGIKHNGMESNPIDTRITVFGKPGNIRGFSTLGARDRKKTKVAKRSGISSDHHWTLSHPGKNNAARNAIGQLVHQPNAAGRGTDKKSLAATSVEATPKRRAAAENSGVGIVGPDSRHQGFVPLPAHDGKLAGPPLNTALNHSIINGTAMGRPALRIGAIGGATKNSSSGVINGTDFRPRHP